jgi:predicted O-methyltransferase YrrM
MSDAATKPKGGVLPGAHKFRIPMNPVLREILDLHVVIDGLTEVPLKDNMDEREGELIGRCFAEVRPSVSVEIGCAYGISAMFACDALAFNERECRHIILDPFQSTHWRGIGIHNLRRAGYDKIVELREIGSEIGLPAMLGAGVRLQCAIIDGWHTFDHTLVDFFYVNKMLDPGGVVIIDDAQWPGIMPVVDHIATYPAYEILTPIGKMTSSMKGKLRRKLHQMTKMPGLRRPWEYPSCVAFRKIAEDARNYDWHEAF